MYCHCNGGCVLSYCKEECLCVVTVMEDMYCHTVRKNVHCYCNGGYVLSYCKEECLCIFTSGEDVCVLSL